MSEKIYNKICEYKECEFKTSQQKKRFCNKCIKERKKIQRRKYNKKYYLKTRKNNNNNKMTDKLIFYNILGVYVGSDKDMNTCDICNVYIKKNNDIGIQGVGCTFCKTCLNKLRAH
jgi:hypothetical protein